jgi:ribosomal-protein-alanine N-acetyltransferase
MTVRFAELNDLDKVLAIEKLSFSNPWDSEFLKNISKDIFLVLGKEEIHGFLIAGCCHKNINASILKIAVHPEYRRRGVATELLHKLFEILRNKQIAEVDVIVKEVWKPAISLYKKVGFEIVSTFPQISRADDLYLMKVDLI